MPTLSVNSDALPTASLSAMLPPRFDTLESWLL